MKAPNIVNGGASPARIISRWRWIILLIGIGIVFVTETIEHSVLTPEYLFEFAVYGIAVAASTWILLPYLAHQLAQQSRLQDSLELQRQFSQQLAHYQDRDELAQYIVRFPSASMPVDQVTLFQYDHLATYMELVAEWNSDTQARPPTLREPIRADAGYVRTVSKAPRLHEATACPLISASGAANTITCARPSLALISDTLTITATAPATLGPLTNTVDIRSVTPDLNLSNNAATAGVSVIDLTAADLSIVKRAGVSQVGVGDALTYTLSVTNAGPGTAQAVTLTDQLPAQVSYVDAWGEGWLCNQASGAVTCSRPDLTLTSAAVMITVTAPLSTTTITNTAEITSASPDWDAANNSSTAAVKVIQMSRIFLPLVLRTG